MEQQVKQSKSKNHAKNKLVPRLYLTCSADWVAIGRTELRLALCLASELYRIDDLNPTADEIIPLLIGHLAAADLALEEHGKVKDWFGVEF